MVSYKENKRLLFNEGEREEKIIINGRHRIYGNGKLAPEGFMLKNLWVNRSRVNNWVSWGWLEKTRRPKILYACVKLAEVDVFPVDTRRKGGDDSCFGEFTARRDEVKTQNWTRTAKMWGDESLRAPFFGFGPQNALYIGRNPADKHVRNTTENQEKKFKVFVCSLFHTLICCFSLPS